MHHLLHAFQLSKRGRLVSFETENSKDQWFRALPDQCQGHSDEKETVYGYPTQNADTYQPDGNGYVFANMPTTIYKEERRMAENLRQ
mmetsp:Transcript_18340/g.52931  ORF Transcript_18340/g.52931 Transcript_18340/m.52931 type:complete len:87 (+) Transcript_18340:418-678(+)